MFGLAVLYILIIFGIFFIQFRKESIVTKIIGPFQLILSETLNQNNQTVLSNNFQLTAQGFSYSANETYPVIMHKDGKDIPLTFQSYRETENSVSLCFDNYVTLTWSSPDPEDVPYTLTADFPETADYVTVPYKMVTAFTTSDVSDDNERKVILSTKEEEYELCVADISESNLTLTPAKPQMSYGYIQTVHVFTFDDVKDLELAKRSVFIDTKQQLRAAVATAFPKAGFTSSSEQAVTAWIAEQAAKGNLTQALNQIPDSIKSSKGHTYFSAPYFDTLASVAPTLRTKLKDLETAVTGAVVAYNPAVYEMPDLDMYMLTHAKAACYPVLDMAQDLDFESLTLGQAGAILQLYVSLSGVKNEYAARLEPVLDSCISLLERNARLEDETLILTENEEPLDRITAAKIGLALAQTGSLISNESAQMAGYMILNTALSELYTLDAEELAELYPLFVSENMYYPHIVLLDVDGTEPVWAWTVAQNMTYKSTGNTIEFTATYPQSGIHYMIVTGIKPFNSIQIYGMQFRTDPRFETYNSSGYVYQADTNTLLLKYRQRSETEVVTLEKAAPAPAKTEQPAATETESKTETPAENEAATTPVPPPAAS